MGGNISAGTNTGVFSMSSMLANVTGNVGTIPVYSFSGNDDTSTSSTSNFVSFIKNITPGAGSANFRMFNNIYTINASGAQSGTATGIFLDATETNLNGIVHNLVDLQVGGSSKFKVANDGNVGINTAIPYAKLHITGGDIYCLNNGGNPRFLFGDSTSAGDYGGMRWDSTSDIIQIGTDTGGFTTLQINESGFVGVGINPTVKFEVDGTIKGNADANINGNTIGKGGGNQLYNTALGASALAVNTTGNYNVGVGSGALQLNQDGTSNTAIGSGALATNVSGGHNVAIGRSALNVNTGSNNFGLGSSALLSNTSGQDNVAIGYLAMSNHQTGSYNVGIGQQALKNGLAKSYNIGIGYFAMTESNANNNIAIGAFSGAAFTSGANNTVIGYVAGASATTNGGMVAIGHQAGRYETGADKLFISNFNSGSEANDRSKSIIYGVMSSTTANQTLALNAQVTSTYALTALTTLELGHASDTTLSRSSA